MFDEFKAGIRYQIVGMFRFCDNDMMKDLLDNDFVEFAARYNGLGQKEEYGRLIKNYYDAFKTISPV